MDTKDFEHFIAIIPQTFLATVLMGVVTMLYKTIKHIAVKTYNEMVDNNAEVKQQLDSIINKLMSLEQESREVKIQVAQFVTLDRFYANAKNVKKEIYDVKEKIARIEERMP